jgi:PHD/YefM family antitoxin component YafN of YafNO toxin-antitoxin module
LIDFSSYTMKTVNALEIRNHLGAVLDDLEKTQEPILVSKGRKVRAVLITPGDFETRFLDRQAEEERDRMLEKIRSLRGKKVGGSSSIDVLRALRGYSD